MIDNIAAFPQQLRAAVQDLNETQLDTPYHPDGWTVRHVVHHVADSHLNSYIRFPWALTEDEPLIKAYDEKAWATLPDASRAEPEVSLALLDALHARWALLLPALTPEQCQRRLWNPETGLLKLETMLGLYDWHGRHHLVYIMCLRQRQGWYAPKFAIKLNTRRSEHDFFAGRSLRRRPGFAAMVVCMLAWGIGAN